MPPTGLKIVGMGACLPWCCIFSSFQNSFEDVWASRLGVSGVLVLQFGHILAWSRFPVCGRLWRIFLLMMRQMFSIGERSWLQAGQFSTKTLILRSHAVVISAVCVVALSCLNTQGLPWNRHHLDGNICCSKTFIYLSALIVPSKTCKLPIAYAHMHPLTSEMLAFELYAIACWKVSLLFCPEDTVSVISNKNVKIGLVWPYNTSKQSILNEP